LEWYGAERRGMYGDGGERRGSERFGEERSGEEGALVSRRR
jgi:hypothetical protein